MSLLDQPLPELESRQEAYHRQSRQERGGSIKHALNRGFYFCIAHYHKVYPWN